MIARPYLSTRCKVVAGSVAIPGPGACRRPSWSLTIKVATNWVASLFRKKIRIPMGTRLTSEGIFVFCGGCATAVAVGDLVEVTGLAEEFFGMSQIDVTGAEGAVSVASSDNPLPSRPRRLTCRQAAAQKRQRLLKTLRGCWSASRIRFT